MSVHDKIFEEENLGEVMKKKINLWEGTLFEGYSLLSPTQMGIKVGEKYVSAYMILEHGSVVESALHSDHDLRTQTASPFHDLFRQNVGITRHLNDPRSVAQVDEDQAAEVASAMHPTGKLHGLTGVFAAQLTRHMRTIGCAV